jgi:hypothetical protein
MSLSKLGLGLTLLAILLLGSAGQSQDKKDPPKKDDKQVVDSKAEKRTPATSINFQKELSLPYSSLGTLGSRIEAARRSSDPVSLAHHASELATAEGVSGKKASLSSKELRKEAAELAKLRREEKELEALVKVSSQVADEQEQVTNLKEVLADEKQRAKAESDAIRRNEEPTGTPRKVLVNNYTTQYVDVYINGFYKMQLQPGQSKWCVIEHKWNPTVLKAYGNQDVTQWGPRYIWGNFPKYTWNLN